MLQNRAMEDGQTASWQGVFGWLANFCVDIPFDHFECDLR